MKYFCFVSYVFRFVLYGSTFFVLDVFVFGGNFSLQEVSVATLRFTDFLNPLSPLSDTLDDMKNHSTVDPL